MELVEGTGQYIQVAVFGKVLLACRSLCTKLVR